MKKIFNYMLVAAAACALAACAVKEEQPLDYGDESITFFLDSEVKSVMENNYMAWQEGDQIGWFNSKNTQKGASTIDLSSTPYSFTIRSNVQIATNATFYFYAPYKEGDQTRTSAPLSIPAEQNGSVTNAMPLVALPVVYNQKVTANTDTNVGTVQFVALASVAQFKVFTTNADYSAEQVQSISFTSESDIAGDFTVDLTTVAESSIPAPAGLSGKSITATLATPATVGANKAAATVVNMSLAPGTLSGTVTVETTGATYELPLNDIPFNRGRIRPLNVDLASPNATRTPKGGSEGPACPYWHNFANGDWGIGPVFDWGGWEDGYYYEMLTNPATLDGASWSLTDAGYYEWAGTEGWRKGIQLGTGGMTVSSFKLSSSSFAGEITKVTLGYNSGITDGSSLTVSCKVGGSAFGTPVAHGDGDYEAVFTGSASGTVEITVSSSVKGAVYLYYVAVEYDPSSGGGGGGEEPSADVETLLTAHQWELKGVKEAGVSRTTAVGNKLTLSAGGEMAFDCTANSGQTYDHTWVGGMINPNDYGEVSDMSWSVAESAGKNYLTVTNGYLLVFAQEDLTGVYEITELTTNTLTVTITTYEELWTLLFEAVGGGTPDPDPDPEPDPGSGPACPYWHNFANGDWGIGPVKDWGGWEDGYYYEQLTHPATLDGASWDLTDAGYFEWAGTEGWRKGIQLGTGGMTVSSFKITSSSFAGDITKVTLGYNSGITDGSSLTVSCKVGGAAFGTPVAHGDGDYEAVFTGSASGTVEITVSSSVKGAVYLYYVAVEYDPGSGSGGGSEDPFDSMTPAEIRAAYSPVWQDEFEGSSVNTAGDNGWIFQTGGSGWGNNEIQYYVNQSVKIGGTTYNTAAVNDGTLKINAYKVSYQSRNYISARMYTKQSWKHGLVEMKAKLPITKGCWSAFWMLPKYGSSYVRDGSMDGGELDIVEYVPNDGANKIYFSAHSYYTTKEAKEAGDFVYYPGNVDFSGNYTLSSTTTAQNDWHTYSLLWTDKYVKAFVDDHLYYTAQNPYPGQHNLPYWGFDQEYYILLNLAIGGDWGGTPASTWPNPAVYEIDYVKVYQSGY